MINCRPPEAGTLLLNFNFHFPGLDMMGGPCLGALKLQGRRQSFWGLQMGRDTAGLRQEEGNRGDRKKEGGQRVRGGSFGECWRGICREEGGEESGAE